MDGFGGMRPAEVVAVVDALAASGCRCWLEGGWGVDALAGRQTRAHRDVDLAIDAAEEADVLAALAGLGYAVETDQRPTRVELVAPGRGRVDVHPLVFGADGSGVQTGPGGERWVYPADCWTTGRVAGRTVGCVCAAQQVAWRSGYELRTVDHHDLAVLRLLLAAPTTG
ncbi:nucleotidyltransferase domain-containing protein [Geodermatophilus sp. SYSU D00815]